MFQDISRDCYGDLPLNQSQVKTGIHICNVYDMYILHGIVSSGYLFTVGF